MSGSKPIGPGPSSAGISLPSSSNFFGSTLNKGFEVSINPFVLSLLAG